MYNDKTNMLSIYVCINNEKDMRIGGFLIDRLGDACSTRRVERGMIARL